MHDALVRSDFDLLPSGKLIVLLQVGRNIDRNSVVIFHISSKLWLELNYIVKESTGHGF